GCGWRSGGDCGHNAPPSREGWLAAPRGAGPACVRMDELGLHEPLAIVGVGCRFPGARDLDAFRALVFEGRCAIAELPPGRFDQGLYYDPRPGAYGKSYG